MKKRFLIENYGPNLKNFKKAFEKTLEIAEENNKNISIIVPSFNNLDTLERFLGESLVKKLRKAPLQTENGIKINLLTDITMSKNTRHPVFFCAHVSEYTIKKLDKFHDIEYEIYVPWMEDDIKYYNTLNHQRI